MQQPFSKIRCLSLGELWTIASGQGRCTGSSWQHFPGNSLSESWMSILSRQETIRGLFRDYKLFFRCTIEDDFGKMLESGQFCDVNFLLGDPDNEVIVQAHASIIAARCQYLQSKLRVGCLLNNLLIQRKDQN